jgi:hypothetical protein
MDKYTQQTNELSKAIEGMKIRVPIYNILVTVSLACSAYSGMTTYGWLWLVVSLYFSVGLIMRVIELFSFEQRLQINIEMAEWQSCIKLNNKIS